MEQEPKNNKFPFNKLPLPLQQKIVETYKNDLIMLDQSTAAFWDKKNNKIIIRTTDQNNKQAVEQFNKTNNIPRYTIEESGKYTKIVWDRFSNKKGFETPDSIKVIENNTEIAHFKKHTSLHTMIGFGFLNSIIIKDDFDNYGFYELNAKKNALSLIYRLVPTSWQPQQFTPEEKVYSISVQHLNNRLLLAILVDDKYEQNTERNDWLQKKFDVNSIEEYVQSSFPFISYLPGTVLMLYVYRNEMVHKRDGKTWCDDFIVYNGAKNTRKYIGSTLTVPGLTPINLSYQEDPIVDFENAISNSIVQNQRENELITKVELLLASKKRSVHEGKQILDQLRDKSIIENKWRCIERGTTKKHNVFKQIHTYIKEDIKNEQLD